MKVDKRKVDKELKRVIGEILEFEKELPSIEEEAEKVFVKVDELKESLKGIDVEEFDADELKAKIFTAIVKGKIEDLDEGENEDDREEQLEDKESLEGWLDDKQWASADEARDDLEELVGTLEGMLS